MNASNPPPTQPEPRPYRHADWESTRNFLRFLIKHIGFTLLARLDRVDGLENIPAQGPGILLINHIAFVDPFIVLHAAPRNIVPLAKIEVYNYPVVGIFPRLWGVIPVRREEVDRRALQQALEVLRAGELILIAPEGTRSPAMTQGKEGVAYLASKAGVPVIPIAVDGTIGYPTLRGSATWRQGGARLNIGRPFRYRADLPRPDRALLRKMTDEALYVLASLLPEHRRGVYGDMAAATRDTLEFL